jgi:hypothetical protein
MQNYDPVEAFQLDLYVREQNSNPDRIDITFDKSKYLPGDTLEANIRITDPVGNPIPKQRLAGSFSVDNYAGQSEETETNIKGESLIRFTLPDTLSAQPRLKVTTKQNPNNPALTMEVNVPCEPQLFELRFLPEGGTFVEGLIQNVGFNATNQRGEPVAITGLLKTGAGTVLDTIQSGVWGPGSFFCKAFPGLYVEILKGAEKGKRWPLPIPTSKGITLSVEPVDKRSFEVEVQSADYNSDPVTVVGVMNSTQIFSKELILVKKQQLVVDTDQLPSGVASFTLFDKSFKPIAERLVFVNSDQRLNFNIQSMKSYQPGQETELSVTVTDGHGKPAEGFFSVAVTDSAGGIAPDLFTPGIEYSYKYHPSFPGNLPARVLAKGLENLNDEERNLLLMVYGWSKFNWDFSTPQTAAKEFPNYDLLNLKILYTSKRHLSGRKLDLVSLEGPSIRHLTTGEAGEITLPLDSLPDITRSVMIMPDVKSQDKVTGSLLSVPYNEQYFKSNKLQIQQPVLPSDLYSVYRPYHFVSMGEKMIEIQEVTIKAHPGNKKVFKDADEATYQFNNVKSLAPEVIWSATTMENAIRKLITPYKVVLHTAMYLHATISILRGPVPVLFVLDGQPLYDQGWPLVENILPDEVTSLTVLDGKQGFIRYGEAAQEGVIFINTKSRNPDLKSYHTKWIAQNHNDKMLLPITLYRPAVEFYNPTKQQLENDQMLQNRATILWEPELYFNGKEPVRIKYTNLKHEGPVVITINGVSVNNLMGTGRGRYLVQ